jgi:hypothetical protein
MFALPEFTHLADEFTLDEFNVAVAAQVRRLGTTRPSRGAPLLSADSFAFTRQISGQHDSKDVCVLVKEMLDFLKVERVIVGHTPVTWLVDKCGGSFLVLDTRMSRWMSGRPPYQADPPENAPAKPTAMVMEMTEDRTRIDSLYTYYLSDEDTEYPATIVIESLRTGAG